MATSSYPNSIPIRQLPQNALDAVLDSLKPRGFQPQTMIEQDYAFSDRDGRQIKTNLLAFAHKKFRSPDYRSLTVFNPANGIHEETLAQTLAQSAAPFHLIHHHKTQSFSFWFTNVSNKVSQRVEAKRFETNIDYSQLINVVERYAVDINPQRIVDVKQGRGFFKHFEHVGAFQLALWAAEVTGDLLVQRFGRAVKNLRSHKLPDVIIPDVATQLLGATILAHTGALGANLRQVDPALDDLITIAYQQFPNYFDLKLFERWYHAIDPAYHILTELRYTNFAPELMTRLYQEAFPDVSQRRELDRYDTPLYLTRRIWDTIPLEFLPPDKRIIADMTCGWGSFLLSGHERLSRMVDMEGRQLRNYIFGNDNEPFTARLAGLGLLISTLQDRWHISDQDAIQWQGPKSQVNIIVGNPPFHGSRKDPSEEHEKSTKRYEKANQFLEHAIDILAPKGYLAMLMPQSFVAAEASPMLRKKLLETCDLIEMWELPIGIFEAQANSLVIFARKKLENGLSTYPVRVRTLQSKQLDVFIEKGPFTASSLVKKQSQWDEHSRRSKYSSNTHIYDYQFILPQFRWDNIRSGCTNLSEEATVFPGTIRGNLERRRHSNDPDGRLVRWLSGARNVIRDSFQIKYENVQSLVYPNDFEKPRMENQSILDGPKVLFNAIANPSWGKRVKAVIDRRGCHFSDNFVIVAPKNLLDNPYITLEVIAAVIDWKVSNAWLLEFLKHARFPMRAIRRIPFPELSKNACYQLSKAVTEIENSQGVRIINNSLQIIDDILREAYQLDDETYERLSLIAEWDTLSPSTLDRQFDSNAQWEISGIVDHVDAKNGQITFWLDGFDELQTVPIIPVMPGWLLRPEAAFRTGIPRDRLRQATLQGNTSWGFFSPQDYAYLDKDELFDELVKVFN